MKIALINSFYSRSKPSGENEIFEQLFFGLEKNGVKVLPITLETDVEKLKLFYPLRSAINVAIGIGGRIPRKTIRKFQPDVIHVHNLFPNFASFWIAKVKLPKILTIHNYRPICAAGTLSRAGAFCNLCVRRPSSAVRYGCYRDSRLATLPFYISRRLRIQERYLSKFQQIIVPSQRAMDIYAHFGVTNHKWEVIPHAIQTPNVTVNKKSDKVLFVGRLSEEKGLKKILELWPESIQLDVIGDGDLDIEKYRNKKEINFLGRFPREEVISILSGYKALIFTSTSPESAFPLVALESLKFGLPLITSDGNTVADAIRVGHFGVILPPNFSQVHLIQSLEIVNLNYEFLSANARKYSSEHHDYELWLKRYEELYKKNFIATKLSERSVR